MYYTELQRKVLILGNSSQRFNSLEQFIAAGVRDKSVIFTGVFQ